MSAKTIANHRRNNVLKACSIPGCHKRRIAARSYCRRHANSASHLGHPLAKAVTAHELKPFLEAAEKILAPFASHPATVLAAKMAEDLIWERTPAGEPRTSAYFTALRVAGVTGYQMLQRIGAIFIMREYQPKRFHASDRYFAYSCALAVIRAAPLRSYRGRGGKTVYCRTPGTVVKAVADYITNHLALFFYKMVAHMAALETEQAARNQTMHEAFTTPTKDSPNAPR